MGPQVLKSVPSHRFHGYATHWRYSDPSPLRLHCSDPLFVLAVCGDNWFVVLCWHKTKAAIS